MSNNKWYHFGRWIEPALSMSLWLALDKTKIYTDLGFKGVSIAKDLDGHYFFLKEELKEITQFIEDKIINNKAWFDKLFSICDKSAEDILLLKNKEDLENFLLASARILNASFAVEFVDYGLERYLEKISEKTGVLVADILSLIRPHKKTLLMEFQEELRNLKQEDIPEFVKKWEWVGTHMFMHEGLTGEKVKKELANISKEESQSTPKIELPDEYRDIIEIGSKLAFYRSYLVEGFEKVSYGYRSSLKELAQKNNLTWDDILLFTYDEVIKLNNEGAIPENYKDREKGFGIINENNEEILITGQELQKELEECREKIKTEGIKELKGIVANKGKVRGVVKIIEDAKYISKINKGEILVANETTPDYIIGMRIAGAIITNQGGLTSHAAITSRELKVPCIIGTKIATKVLRDGDEVEVDVEKGIVKIINTR